MSEKRSFVRAIAQKELKKERKEKLIFYTLIGICILIFLVFVVLMGLQFISITGFSTFVESFAGEITELEVTIKRPVENWGGLYGLVLRVPDFTQQLSEDLDSADIQRADVFFDCLKVDATGGPEFYASTDDSLDLLTANVVPATTSMVDSLLNCTGEVFCANNTFTQNMTIYLGTTRISEIPSTRTYQYQGRTPFDIGILNVSNSLVFVSHINASMQKGYNPSNIVNYQMLLPTPANSTQTFYFYNDPFDSCPAGGIGNSVLSNIYGYVKDYSSNPISGAIVTFAGTSTSTDSNGFYNLSTLVLEGEYALVSMKSSYETNISGLNITYSSYILEKNISMKTESNGSSDSNANLTIFGYINDSSGNYLTNVSVYFGHSNYTTNSTGHYVLNVAIPTGYFPLIAFKANYDNYYKIILVNASVNLISHNFSMVEANLNTFPTGPFTNQKQSDNVAQDKQAAKKIAEELGQDYWVSTREINKQVREGTFVDDDINFYNFKSSSMKVFLKVSSELEGILELDRTTVNILSGESSDTKVTIWGKKPIGVYRGKIELSGDIEQEIPVKIEIVPRKIPVEALLMDLELFKDKIVFGELLRYKLNLENLLTNQPYTVDLNFIISDRNGTKVFFEKKQQIEIKSTLALIDQINIPRNFSEGDYLLIVEAKYFSLFSSVNVPFSVNRPLYLYSFFGIPLWIIFVALFMLSFFTLNFYLYKRSVEKKKRYHLTLYPELLPKPSERSIKLGHLAEKTTPAFYNLDDLTTHAIVAGATGGGKSISAQVFVEEALMKGIAVVVFDPTAQWSGMLRKCDDKKMMANYSKFGLKLQDAKAFAGNVRQITNYKEALDIGKYINPGQIQVFTMNKLDPSQIDIFVAGVISGIFKSDPKESPNLKVLLVFDEVHRLLPKFGGSGKGFLQIERACREFRKWGLGVMLVSQVLSDFVGEIKANINTEIQMRVAEENDLARIKERYGEESLKSLVRADVGTGMIQNAEYNKGLPYFVALRPILHNTRRLPDEILDKYNKYNETIDDMQFQIEQLDAEKVDVFDLKMELKLVKDKLMSGNFTVVDIYLEGLKPRLDKQWEKIGKTPKKREIKLIDEKELDSALAEAQKNRKKWEAEHPDEVKKAENVKEDVTKKIVKAFTFDNGAMVSSFDELKDLLPTLDAAVLRVHVKESKNEIANWIGAEIDKDLGGRLLKLTKKEDIIKELDEFKKNLNSPKKEEDKKVEVAGEANKSENKETKEETIKKSESPKSEEKPDSDKKKKE